MDLPSLRGTSLPYGRDPRWLACAVSSHVPCPHPPSALNCKVLERDEKLRTCWNKFQETWDASEAKAVSAKLQFVDDAKKDETKKAAVAAGTAAEEAGKAAEEANKTAEALAGVASAVAAAVSPTATAAAAPSAAGASSSSSAAGTTTSTSAGAKPAAKEESTGSHARKITTGKHDHRVTVYVRRVVPRFV